MTAIRNSLSGRHCSGESQPGCSQAILQTVFDKINECGFRVSLGKCFFLTSIKYLGFIVDNEGRRSDLKKITAVADMPAPTITILCSFLRLVSY